MPDSSPELPAPLIENHILLIRGQKVLPEADLARLYQVTTGNPPVEPNAGSGSQQRRMTTEPQSKGEESSHG
jgi:hypothetical protein